MIPVALNLDALRAPSRKVQFLGVDFELGYIPAGAAIPVTEGYNRLLEAQTKAMGGQATPEAEAAYRQAHSQEIAQANVEYVAGFCSFWDSSFTPDRVGREATTEMVDSFFVEIIRTLMETSSRVQGRDGQEKKSPTGVRP